MTINVKLDYKPRHRKTNHSKRRNISWFSKFGVLAIILSPFILLNNKVYESDHHSEEITLPNVNMVHARYTPLPETTTNWSTYKVKAGDSLASLLKQFSIPSSELPALLDIGAHAKYLKQLFPGQNIHIKTNESGKILALKQQIDELKTLQLEKQNDKFVSTLLETPVETRIAFGTAVIHDSLFLAGKRSNLEDKLIMELANIFAYDIDFALDIQPNDSFKVLFEEKYVDGQKIGVGSILAAEFTNDGKTYQAIRYVAINGHADYYAPDGSSLKKAFIRTPVKYTRISSHFNLKRMHPILHKIRAHKGVDYAAPRGTPVKASGNGKVAFIGKKGGYGNAIILQHGTKYSTLYGHLSRFNKKLKTGSKVSQGDIIAYVGSTGLATAPHLHYEFRINGVHHNPLTVALPNGQPVKAKYKSDFLAQKSKLLALMDYQDRMYLASRTSNLE